VVRIEVPRSEVRPGEGWAGAADRLAGARTGNGHGPVLALDLTGDPLVFLVDEQHQFAVRPMTVGDFPDVVRWVNAPHVARWWDRNRTPEQVAAYYGPAVRGEEPTRMWVWEVNGRSVGFAQDYRIADHPDYALLCGHPDAVGFDYAIGEAAYAGRGLGTSLLWVFLRDIVAPGYPDLAELFAAPDHRNVASRRVLAKVGAVEGLWFDEPETVDGPAGTVVGCALDVAQVMGSTRLPMSNMKE
jgi:RimJ/RimL family protein N-acetyltransferase